MNSLEEVQSRKKEISSVLDDLMSYIDPADLDQEECQDSVYSCETMEQTLSYYKSIHDNLQSQPAGIHRAQAIWQEVYAFFELDDQANELTIESHLEQARECIPSILSSIQSINFGPINLQLNQEIASFVKTLRDYSFLFTHRHYMHQISRVFWEIDEALNKIEYVESLYPSRRLLAQAHPAYGTAEFDSIYKTLILWHKTMREVTGKLNQLGYLFGFDHEDYRDFWPWFGDYLENNRFNRDQHRLSSQLVESADLNELSKLLTKKREACIHDFVKGNKFNYRSIFAAIGQRMAGTMTRVIQTLLNEKCYLDGNMFIFENESFHYQFCQESEHFYYHMLPLHPRLKIHLSQHHVAEGVLERAQYGVKSETFIRLGLPTFRPIFFYLMNNILEILQTCIQVHLEMNRDVKIRTDIQYNLLCIESYVKQSRELIEDTIVLRQKLYHAIFSMFEDQKHEKEYEVGIHFITLDKLLKDQIKAYLDFIRLWCEELIKLGNYVKALDVLDTEWTFCKNNFHYVTSSEDLHAETFGYILQELNRSFLTEIQHIERDCKDPLIKHVRDEIFGSTLTQQALRESLFGVNLMCNQLKCSLKNLENMFAVSIKFHQRIIRDMEIVAKYEVKSSIQRLLDKLDEHDFVHVAFKTWNRFDSSPTSRPFFMVFIPSSQINEKISIVRLLFINNEIDEFYKVECNAKHIFKKDFAIGDQSIEVPNQTNGYLLYLHLPSTHEVCEWKGRTIDLYTTIPIYSSLHEKNIHKASSSSKLTLLTAKQSILEEKRMEVEKKLGEECLNLHREKTSFHPNFDVESIMDNIKESMLLVRKTTIELVYRIESDLMSLLDSHQVLNHIKLGDRDLEEILRLYFLQVCRVAYTLCLKFEVIMNQFMTTDQCAEFSKGITAFFIQLSRFFVNRGESMMFSAISEAIEMIQLVKASISYLDDAECLTVSSRIDALFARATVHMISILQARSNQEVIKYDIKKGSNKYLPPGERFKAFCSKVDQRRRSVLLDKRYIGKALESERSDYKIQPSEVSFRWQAGIQIGKGRFGIVYSCANLDTGGMMALKIIYLHKIMKKKESEKVDAIADEINNVLRIEHPNLVKVFGAELNRTSIYIFMEYCGINCTLEKLCKQTTGLSEELVRSYTNQLLRAVEALHDNHIIHRDIKPQNIFLKEIDSDNQKYLLKLGDFGCSFNFNNANETFKANEIVGTPYYMAPEVMLSESLNDCYSYSADIWSVGCVVIEMWTSTRPWYPLEPFQISMKLCIDKTSKPQYPTEIKDEAIKFLDRCIQYEPDHRDTAEQLLSHSFLMISI